MTPDDPFGPAYWDTVDTYGTTCHNCGHSIKPATTATGWTHDPDVAGGWEGVRCPNLLTGATPATPAAT